MRSVVLVVASAAGSAAFVPLAGSAPHVVADCASFAAAAASVMRPALLRMPRANTAETLVSASCLRPAGKVERQRAAFEPGGP